MSPSPDLVTGEVRATHIWKRYRADARRSKLRHELGRLWRRSPRPWTWVLRDAELDVSPGDSTALVGLNGSGKSTLLKILSGVATQTAGSVAVRGRIGALIEVKAGIHPELTGRENIFFAGTVLGLSRREVAARFDDMVDFAEIGDAIDRPVRFYSTGMSMRLGFTVAAFLEPDILMVDEALAVGDMGFQQRCIERMRKVQEQGATLLYVSHDLASVEAMCRQAVWLDGGVVRASGPTRPVLAQYREGLEEKASLLASVLDQPVALHSVHTEGLEKPEVVTGEPWVVYLELMSQIRTEADLCIGVSQGPASPIFLVSRRVEIEHGSSRYRITLHSLPLPRGRYYLWAGVFGDSGILMSWLPAAPLDVEGDFHHVTPRGVMLLSPVAVKADWDDGADGPWPASHLAASPQMSARSHSPSPVPAERAL